MDEYLIIVHTNEMLPLGVFMLRYDCVMFIPMRNVLIIFMRLVTGVCIVPESQLKFDYTAYFAVEISEPTMMKRKTRQRISTIYQ